MSQSTSRRTQAMFLLRIKINVPSADSRKAQIAGFITALRHWLGRVQPALARQGVYVELVDVLTGGLERVTYNELEGKCDQHGHD